MSARIVEMKTSTHNAVQELLPWFVNGTLDDNDLALVHEHLETCVQCRSDVEFHRKLSVTPLPDDVGVNVDRAYTKLVQQLLAQEGRKSPKTLMARLRGLGQFLGQLLGKLLADGMTMRWVAGAQFAAIAGLCFILFQPQHEAEFHGLGAVENQAGNIVVMFKPQTTEQEWRRILQASGARVVDGPSVTDAYLLKVAPAEEAHAISVLKAEQAILLAEPLDGRSHP